MSDTVTMLDAVGAPTAGTATAFGATPGAMIHVYSAAGSSATVLIQGAMTAAGPWATLATIANPSATGEVWQGTSFPYLRVNCTVWASGAVSAYGISLDKDPGAWAAAVAAQTSTAPSFGVIKRTWTNAEIVAEGTGGTSALLDVGALPANSQLLSAYVIVGTQATFAAGTLTMGVGRTSATYVDFIAASDLKGTAGTIYGNAAAERATDAAIQFFAAATDVKAIVTGGAGDLANVTGSTGTIYLLYATYP